MRTALVIPALDEEEAIGGVVSAFVDLRDDAGRPVLEEIVVADNGSTDRTAAVARAAGATVVGEPERGYGAACLAALQHLRARGGGPPDIVAFADGDGSNVAAELPSLIEPLVTGRADLVIGSRLARAAPGSLTFPQRFGNRLSTTAMNRLFGARFSDLGPYRAIAWPALERLEMEDRNYGWTIEMQLKAVHRGLVTTEVDVQNRARVAGRSKVAGTVRGVIGAGTKILWSLWRYRR